MIKDISNFLPALAYHFVLDEEFRYILTSCGFNPMDLPKENNGFRDIIISFSTATDKKEIKWIYEKLREFKDHESINQIPLDDSFGPWYKQMLFNYKVRQLAPELTKDPDKFLSSYSELIKLKDTSLSDVISFTKTFDLELDRFILDIRENKTLKEIPNWEKLSKMIGGFNAGRLSMILANTGYGKTNFMINLALGAVNESNVLFVNMEMLYEDIFRRIVVAKSNCSWDDIRNKKEPDVVELINSLSNSKELLITSGKDQSLDDIKNIARVYNNKFKLGLICIDYDQKLRLNYNNKNPEWLELQRAFISLEDLAKELNTHIIVASQASDEEGKVSGSHRSKFPCSTVLYFHEDELEGAVIEAKKNRFGNYSKRLKVNYIKEKSLITEGELIDAKSKQKSKVEFGKTFGAKPTFAPYKD